MFVFRVCCQASQSPCSLLLLLYLNLILNVMYSDMSQSVMRTGKSKSCWSLFLVHPLSSSCWHVFVWYKTFISNEYYRLIIKTPSIWHFCFCLSRVLSCLMSICPHIIIWTSDRQTVGKFLHFLIPPFTLTKCTVTVS